MIESIAALRETVAAATGKQINQFADSAFRFNNHWMIGPAENEPEGSPAYLVTPEGLCLKKTHQDSDEIDDFVSQAVEVTG
ncbi:MULTISPECIES: hypothetical protein [Corynebacterium]|uniref:hypothetical protein n=1 Tax=Corynebacterium TaxID=1716 RepID=UPI0008A83442|nr:MULTISPECIES: hypothetical protein [Corynebacterium]MBC6763208.1 hypothetical protein [Corynebacterium sp. LK27]MDK7110693.1 hypothetical protein [Corynebacterium amycolatum]MDK7145726.1 hypothetical protein [Corynebacterium amycolatum]OHR29892.1 hypothetical protein HMPREF2847_06765 [Corynebacterium sp. HMSC074C03]